MLTKRKIVNVTTVGTNKRKRGVMNRKRTKRKAMFTRQVLIRFSEEEYALLRDKAKKAGLSHSELIRRLVRGTEIKASPPQCFDYLICEMKSIGNKLNSLDNLIIEKNSSQGILVRDCEERVHHATVLLNQFSF